MTSTTFVDYSAATPIVASWLNDVNNHAYNSTPISPATTVHPATVIAATAATNNAATTVQGQLTNVGSATGATNVGYTPSGTGAVATTVQNKLHEIISVKDFGAIGNNSADDTAAIQAAMNAIYTNGGGTLYIPKGIYRISANLVQQTSPTSNFFRILGDGMSASVIYGGDAGAGLVGYGIQIFGAAPPSSAASMVNVVLDGFSMTCNSHLGTGIDLSSVQRFSIRNVQCAQFNYGLRIRNVCIQGTVEGSCYFEANNVGIKCTDSNVISFEKVSCKQNVKAGISLSGCAAINISTVNLESNPVGLYMLNSCLSVTMNNLYYEPPVSGFTRTDRNGANAGFLMRTGDDEDATVYNNTLPNKQLCILSEYRGGDPFYLNNVDGVTFPNTNNGNIFFGIDVKNISGNAFAGNNAVNSLFVQGKAKASATKVMHSFPYNWIANGDFSLPSMPKSVLTSSPGGTSSYIKQAETVNGVSENVCDITCANGDTTVTMRFPVKVNNEYATSYGAQQMLAAAQLSLSSITDVSIVEIAIRDSSLTLVNYTDVTGANFGTGFKSISVQGALNAVTSPSPLFYVDVTIVRTTGVGAINCVLKEVVLAPVNQFPLLSHSTSDWDAGWSGTVTCSTLSTAWYYADVVTGIGNATYFTVQLTAEYDTLQTVTTVQAQRLTGGSAGTVRIWSNKNGAIVHYRIVPSLTVTV